MSQEDNPNSPPRPSSKTSAVPLKKETMRITLRPNAPLSETPETVPLAPPAPTVNLGAPPPPRPAVGAPPPAPSVGGPPRPAPPVAPVGSKTIPLGATPPRPATPLTRPAPVGGGAAPAPLRPAAPSAPGGGTQPMPQATVKLAPAPAPTVGVASAPIRPTSFADDDDDADDTTLNIMGWISLAASLAVLFLALASITSGPLALFSEGTADTAGKKKIWQDNNAVEGFNMPMDYSPFDTKQGETVTSHYEREEPKIPVRESAQ